MNAKVLVVPLMIVTMLFSPSFLPSPAGDPDSSDPFLSTEVAVGVYIVTSDVMAHNITYYLENTTEHAYSYEEEYRLYIREGSSWMPVKPVNEPVFSDTRLPLDAFRKTAETVLDWSEAYGNLPDGHYKFVKKVQRSGLSDDEGTFVLEQEFWIWGIGGVYETIGEVLARVAGSEQRTEVETRSGTVAIIVAGTHVIFINENGLTMQVGSLFDAYHILWDSYECYPDDIGGFYWDSFRGKTIVLLTDMSEERVNELTELFGNDPSVGFAHSSVSYNEILRIQREITEEYMWSNDDIYSVAIGWISADDGIGGFGESGGEPRVCVGVDEAAVDSYSKIFHEAYGEMVSVGVGGPIELLAEDNAFEPFAGTDGSLEAADGLKAFRPSMLPWVIASCLGAVIAVACVVLIRNRNRAQKAALGSTISEGRDLHEPQ